MKVELIGDKYGFKVQAFAFNEALTVVAGIELVLDTDTLVHIGTDTDITLDGIAVPFTIGDKIILRKSKGYTFSVDTSLGIS